MSPIALKIGLLVGLIGSVLACGPSAEETPQPATDKPGSAQVAPVGVVATVAPASSPRPAPTSTSGPVAKVKTGNAVGDHVPEFEMRLVDGSVETSTSFLGTGRPVFLFFFATW